MGWEEIDFYDISSDDRRFLMARSLQRGTRSVNLVQHFFEELTRLVPN